jgi:hypothetical protein
MSVRLRIRREHTWLVTAAPGASRLLSWAYARGEPVLRQLDQDIWVIDHDLRMLGLELGTRTTLVRLSSGDLFMHSPGPLSVHLAQQIDALGAVRCIVAPNRFHHLYVSENAKAYQAASVHLAPGLEKKRKDLSYNEVLGDTPSRIWSKDIDQIRFEGAPTFDEVAFLHRASRTLILTDLAFNFGHAPSFGTRLFLKLNGALGAFGPSRMMRMLVRDREKARVAMERILEWNFDRIIVSHGDVLEGDARHILRTSYAWLVGESAPE